MTITDWLLDADPSIRWQTLADLLDAPAQVVAAERARVASEGWGARILSLQGDDGLWAGGALFPGKDGEPLPWRRQDGQPWTATAYSLQMLADLGVDPADTRVREAIDRVRDTAHWEHDGQPFFEGEVEPCINGMVVLRCGRCGSCAGQRPRAEARLQPPLRTRPPPAHAVCTPTVPTRGCRAIPALLPGRNRWYRAPEARNGPVGGPK